MAAILADSNSLSMVISPTLDFSRAISSSRSSRSRSFRADAAPASARSRHSVSLAKETFASRATTSNGSPRNKIPWGVDSGRLWEQTEVVNPLNPWRRPMSLDHRCEEPTAIRSNVGAIFVSLELSRSTWLITSLSPGSGEKMAKYGISAGDLAALRRDSWGSSRRRSRGRENPFNRRHSGGGTGWFLDSSRTAKRGNRELRGRSGLDCDVTPAAASQDR